MAWQRRGDDIRVSMPAPGADGLPADGMVVLEIEGMAE
jgi:hypothetical protein